MAEKFTHNMTILMSQDVFIREDYTIFDWIKLFDEQQKTLRSFPYQQEADRARLILLTAVIIDNDATVKFAEEENSKMNLEISFSSKNQLTYFELTLNTLTEAKILF